MWNSIPVFIPPTPNHTHKITPRICNEIKSEMDEFI